MARESMAAPAHSFPGSPKTIRPPVARAISSAVRRAKTLLQSLVDLFEIGERKLAVADDLLALVPLARDQHGPAGLGREDRIADGFAAVRHHPIITPTARPHPLLDRG